MSDLAYTFSGDKFDVSPDATLWRVRRFKAPGTRGAPEVVYDEEGLPLTVPIDTTMAELREAVGNITGRYRLDPLDEHGAAVGDTAAYVQVRPSVGKGAEVLATASADTFMHELVRANTEMMRVCNETTRVVTEKLAQIMESAAVLVRAADGAGIASRTPPPLSMPPQNALSGGSGSADNDDDDDDSDEAGHPGNNTLAMILQMAVEKAMPLINHAIHTKVLGLSSAQSMALMGNAPAVPGNVATSPYEPIQSSRAKDDATADRDSVPTKESHSSHQTIPTPAKAPSRGLPDDNPMAFVNQLTAIEQFLAAEEIEGVKRLVAQLSPTELMEWRTRLMSAAAEEAASLIREEMKARSL